MKINKLYFQRNGVAGEGFYTAEIIIEWGKLIATFNVNRRDTKILRQSCRVIRVSNPSECFQGDQVGMDIQTMFEKTKHKYYYDWMLSYQPAAVKDKHSFIH